MSELAPLVESLFRLKGYEADAQHGPNVLVFHRGPERVAVRVREARDVVSVTVATELAETLPVLGRGILVCFADIGHEARHIIERAGIDVWTREKLIHEVGSAWIGAAQHGERPPEPERTAPDPEPASQEPTVIPASAAPEPLPAASAAPAANPAATALWAMRQEPANAPAPRPEPLAPPMAPTFASLLMGAAASAAPSPRPPQPPPAVPLAPQIVTIAPPPPAAAPAPPTAALPATGLTVLALAADREEALRIGTGRLLTVERMSLELVPLYAYRYTCRLEPKGAPAQGKQGLLAVDAVTAAVRDLPEPAFAPPPERGQRLEPMVPEEEGPDIVRRRVVDLHTQKIRVKSNLGRSAAIVADEWVRPNPRTIVAEPQGTWYLPIWRLEGQNGSLRINGATGAIEEEKLKRAFATDAEFL